MATSGWILYGFDDIMDRLEPSIDRLNDLLEQVRKNPTTTVVDAEQLETEVTPVVAAFLKAVAGIK